MFLSMLTPHQQGVFLGAARAMANADSRQDEREAELLDAFERETGLTPAVEPMAASDVPAAIAAFDSQPRRVAALVELASVALADGNVHEAERQLLDGVAKAVGLGPMGWREDLYLWLSGVALLRALLDVRVVSEGGGLTTDSRHALKAGVGWYVENKKAA